MKNVFLKRPYACAGVDPAWMRILEKSCRNWHSEQTAWPWYSYVAPLSRLIEKYVHDARSHLNLSRWSEYDSQTQHDLLAELAAAVRSRRLPLPGYALLHPEDKPSSDEFERIYQWTRAERRRLVSLASAHSSASAEADVAG
jgi:hypothetical protein